MVKKDNALEKKLTKEFFKDLDRAIVCPHQMCREMGEHFRCYDSTYENCSHYKMLKLKRKV